MSASDLEQFIEDYHRAVVRAHRQHAGVEAQIPMPVPPPPEGVLVATGNGQTAHAVAGAPPQPIADGPAPPRPDAGR